MGIDSIVTDDRCPDVFLWIIVICMCCFIRSFIIVVYIDHTVRCVNVERLVWCYNNVCLLHFELVARNLCRGVGEDMKKLLDDEEVTFSVHFSDKVDLSR